MSADSETYACVDGVCSVFPEEDCISFCETEEKLFNYMEKGNLTQCSFDPKNLLIKGILKGHTDEIYSVAVSPDGKFIVTGSRDNTAKV